MHGVLENVDVHLGKGQHQCPSFHTQKRYSMRLCERINVASINDLVPLPYDPPTPTVCAQRERKKLSQKTPLWYSLFPRRRESQCPFGHFSLFHRLSRFKREARDRAFSLLMPRGRGRPRRLHRPDFGKAHEVLSRALLLPLLWISQSPSMAPALTASFSQGIADTDENN